MLFGLKKKQLYVTSLYFVTLIDYLSSSLTWGHDFQSLRRGNQQEMWEERGFS